MDLKRVDNFEITADKKELSSVLFTVTIFGKGTESALYKFQKARRISADTKAGKGTFTKLFAA
ncbi:peptidoglycan-binding domain-containing protein [Peribacillus simplex]|uniref:peptidoglycan-binding domain-containing protein n=1 Tax=Peribacillus simplex TaxID=1478 RepID=UPI003D9B599C